MKSGSRILFFLAIVSIGSCSKEHGTEGMEGNAVCRFSLRHEIDDEDLLFNQIIYHNASGDSYGVTRLHYFLSEFRLRKADGTWYEPNFSPQFIDGASEEQFFDVLNVIPGIYNAASFTIGIPEFLNITGALENTLENTNMAWPDELGGGYHFLKFEGRFFDDNGDAQGFTVHLGSNGFQCLNEMEGMIRIKGSEINRMELIMNLNQWFEGPHTFSLRRDGNYTMGRDSLMNIIVENGRNCMKFIP